MADTVDRSAYDLSGVVDVDQLRGVRSGSTLLVSGPAMTGKEQVVRSVLADGLARDEGVIAITTGGPGGQFVADLEEATEGFEGRAVSVVDCRADGDREHETLENGANVHHVPDPADLTGIGVCITEALDRLEVGGYDRGRLGLTSLSTMLTYTDEKTVFKFCHVLASRIDAAGFVGLFTIDASAHEQRTLQVLKQAFDGQLELREADGERQVRVRGLGQDPSDWRPL